MPGEPGPIAAGAFDADELEGPEGLEPSQQLPIARGRRLEALHAEKSASFVEGSCHVTSRCVSTPPVILRAIVVIVILSFAWGGWHRTSQTMDRTAMGLCGRLL